MKKNSKDTSKVPFYKKWWFWGIVVVVGLIGLISGGNPSSELGTSINDYTGQDAKQAYDELTAAEYEVSFVFDRNNNGGFTKEGFQDHVLKSFASESYNELPFTVTKQSVSGKQVTFYVDYATSLEADKAKKEREDALEEKLGLVESMTACEQYGKKNYPNFKLHGIMGKIAEYASDDDTWFLKYKVDADGYENMTMECYVTGTSASPQIEKFVVY